MAFIKGMSGNPQGRPKGAANRTSEELRISISNFLNEQFADVVKNYQKLEPKDRLKFFLDLLQFGLPKLAATTNEINFDKLTDEQLDLIIEKLKQNAA